MTSIILHNHRGDFKVTPSPPKKDLTMDLKETGTITVDKNQKQKIKCYRFYSENIDRTLILHEDVENKNYSSVSDDITGYRLFVLNQKASTVKPELIEERLNKFIKHFTLDSIREEFKRIENLPQPESGKKKQ